MTITKTHLPVKHPNLMDLIASNRAIEKMLAPNSKTFKQGRFVHYTRSERALLRQIMKANSHIITTL